MASEPPFHKPHDEADYYRMKSVLVQNGAVEMPCPWCGKVTPVYTSNLKGSDQASVCLWCEKCIQVVFPLKPVKAKWEPTGIRLIWHLIWYA